MADLCDGSSSRVNKRLVIGPCVTISLHINDEVVVLVIDMMTKLDVSY